MPWTMAAFVAGGLSLIGVPLTVGFISKWYLVLAAIELGWWPVVAVIIVGSLLAVIYIWRVVEVAYLQPAETPSAARRRSRCCRRPGCLIGRTSGSASTPAHGGHRRARRGPAAAGVAP
jgi:NADH:ubiquinone oxidoreductase subunit 2 (subunit N)